METLESKIRYHYDMLMAEIETTGQPDLLRLDTIARLEAWREDIKRRDFIRMSNSTKKVTKDSNAPKKIALTICPADNTDHKVLYNILDILNGITSIIDYIAVMEQRSNFDEEAHGWHLHLSVVSKYPPAAVKKFILQKLNAKKRNIRAFICAKEQNDDNWEKRYMRGNKKSSDTKLTSHKTELCKKDEYLRTLYNIPDVIYKNPNSIFYK